MSPAIIHQRDVYATSGYNGQTASDNDPNSRASQEIAALWTYVRNRRKQEIKHAA